MALDNNVKVTDVQVWNRFLTVEEMIAYTSCDFSIKGYFSLFTFSHTVFRTVPLNCLSDQ